MFGDDAFCLETEEVDLLDVRSKQGGPIFHLGLTLIFMQD